MTKIDAQEPEEKTGKQKLFRAAAIICGTTVLVGAAWLALDQAVIIPAQDASIEQLDYNLAQQNRKLGQSYRENDILTEWATIQQATIQHRQSDFGIHCVNNDPSTAPISHTYTLAEAFPLDPRSGKSPFGTLVEAGINLGTCTVVRADGTPLVTLDQR